jgi:hypothetical protein
MFSPRVNSGILGFRLSAAKRQSADPSAKVARRLRISTMHVQSTWTYNRETAYTPMCYPVSDPTPFGKAAWGVGFGAAQVDYSRKPDF